ncbi:MAG TPA: rhomboid family intramembrane serine protease [Thermoplasmata archaeon]|nr:rhomboid family intramembrane serine protease [Thermoplasmata archaeon]
MQPVSLAAIAVIVLATAYGFLRKAPLSLIYAVAILAVFALQVSSSALGFVRLSPVTFELGLFAAPGSPPAPWSWITFEFVHASETHILLNLLGLILISPTLEERIGSARWAILFFVGGAAGALVFLLVHFGDVVLLVGASAGIFAVFGAYGRLYPRDRVALFLPIRGIPSLPVVEVVVIFLVLETLLGLLGPLGIAWEAHVGALIFGFAAAPMFMRLPLRGGRARLIPVRAIQDLATTPELERILKEAERADLPETREAWIESFVRAARCPRCAGPLRRRFGRIVSDCGWRRRL